MSSKTPPMWRTLLIRGTSIFTCAAAQSPANGPPPDADSTGVVDSTPDVRPGGTVQLHMLATYTSCLPQPDKLRSIGLTQRLVCTPAELLVGRPVNKAPSSAEGSTRG
jgi:hypothetical protein